MIDNVISDLLNIEIVSIFKTPDNSGNNVIYLSDSANEIFTTARYGGYLRNIRTSYFQDTKLNIKLTKCNYKLVLFFSLTDCIDHIKNKIERLWLSVPKDDIVTIKPTESYFDSWDNIKKELGKDKTYLKYRVVVIDIETEEKFCSNKKTC